MSDPASPAALAAAPPSARVRPWAGGLAALLMLCAALPCRPQASAPQAASAPRLATAESYARCLDAGDGIERRRTRLEALQAEHNTMAIRLREADERFNGEVRRRPPRGAAELKAYNEAIESRNQQVLKLNERALALQRATDQLNAQVFAYNEACGSLFVSSEVKAAVEKARAQAASAAGD